MSSQVLSTKKSESLPLILNDDKPTNKLTIQKLHNFSSLLRDEDALRIDSE